MLVIWANEFGEIPATLVQRPDLRDAMLRLIADQPMPGKVTEGGDRLGRFREILGSLTRGELNLQVAYDSTETQLPRNSSIHRRDNRVFSAGWAERLVRTQFSRFYNQAVMEQLAALGETRCYVPHSSAEDPITQCSQLLAGQTHEVSALYGRLIGSYAEGNWRPEPRIPDHPHCTHVVKPARDL